MFFFSLSFLFFKILNRHLLFSYSILHQVGFRGKLSIFLFSTTIQTFLLSHLMPDQSSGTKGGEMAAIDSTFIAVFQLFKCLNVPNSKVISAYQPGYCYHLGFAVKSIFTARCWWAIVPSPCKPPSSLSPFVSLFSVHKYNPLNLKSFPAQVNECNYKPMVSEPQEHMNKA